ncbi:hypothetical protein [Desulfolucanica intricata]|uniref:hypothetical protein n=1 Tax=Desulfolucanica intricata TaxID=1285191 RepID=UPI00082D7069|nr:hypothetical protein [Desulfolucanica intricata]
MPAPRVEASTGCSMPFVVYTRNCGQAAIVLYVLIETARLHIAGNKIMLPGVYVGNDAGINAEGAYNGGLPRHIWSLQGPDVTGRQV